MFARPADVGQATADRVDGAALVGGDPQFGARQGIRPAYVLRQTSNVASETAPCERPRQPWALVGLTQDERYLRLAKLRPFHGRFSLRDPGRKTRKS